MPFVQRPIHSAIPSATVNACSDWQYVYMSNLPAKILCSVKNGAQTGWPSLSLSKKLSENPIRYPVPFASWHFDSSATTASPFVFNCSSPVLAYPNAHAERKCPVKCPRSSQSGASHPPNGSAVLASPALTRKLCSNRFTGREGRYCRFALVASRNGPSSSRTCAMGNGAARSATRESGVWCRPLCSRTFSKASLVNAPAVFGRHASAADDMTAETNCRRETQVGNFTSSSVLHFEPQRSTLNPISRKRLLNSSQLAPGSCSNSLVRCDSDRRQVNWRDGPLRNISDCGFYASTLPRPSRP